MRGQKAKVRPLLQVLWVFGSTFGDRKTQSPEACSPIGVRVRDEIHGPVEEGRGHVDGMLRE